MDAPFTDTRAAMFLLSGVAALLVLALALAARRRRSAMWMLAGGIAGVALVMQWIWPDGLPLSSFRCGPLCGSGIDFMPAAVGAAALGTAAVLSVRHRWVPQGVRYAVALVVGVIAVWAGIVMWYS